MEPLSETVWDVVISGTDLPQSLLALSLSRSGKKILHIDRNRYYGGDDAAFTLQEAEEWVRFVGGGHSQSFSNARIIRPTEDTTSLSPTTALSSRAYSLSLAPQIIYARSRFLQTLVSSQLHTQLEFLAIGSWWTCTDGNLRKIPGNREDVFADDSLSRREKVALMKLLRYVFAESENKDANDDVHVKETLREALSSRFGLPTPLQAPVLALSLSTKSSGLTDFDFAMSRIKRHMQSIGVFGASFGAVIPKYGGNAEIAQVACRACAVGGGVYMLGQGVKALNSMPAGTYHQEAETTDENLVNIELSDGEKIKTRRVIGSTDSLPRSCLENGKSSSTSFERSLHSISIISEPLVHLFPPVAENSPPSAVAIVLVGDYDKADDGDLAPVYLQVHSEETGECPRGQCVIYGSTVFQNDKSKRRLELAVKALLGTGPTDSVPIVLWSMSYMTKRCITIAESDELIRRDLSERVLVFRTGSLDLAFDDSTLENVKAVWKQILGDQGDENEFLRFEEREQADDE